jgi:Alpha/beta hydrolase
MRVAAGYSPVLFTPAGPAPASPALAGPALAGPALAGPAPAGYARLRVTDPGRWRALARDWRRWAALAGDLVAALTGNLARLGRAWSGTAASAAAGALSTMRRRLVLFRVLCWRADQAASEFAAALERARLLLSRALAAATRSGWTVDAWGNVHDSPVRPSAGPVPGPVPLPGAADLAAAGAAGAAGAAHLAAGLAAAVAIAERADDVAAARLTEVAAAPPSSPWPAGPGSALPDCTAAPAAFARWWAGLGAAGRWWLLAEAPGLVAGLDGLPVADRDVANRLLLAERRAAVDRMLTAASTGERDRLGDLRRGLDALADRLADDENGRAYLLRLDPTEEGRAVVSLGDPDRADNVVTHVPGMTAGLATATGELTRAARVAGRAAELGPAAATSAVLWLDYDAPDFIDEAAGTRRADDGSVALRNFQDGLRASHVGPAARQTVLGHSYGSLVVGTAAATSGLAADEVVFLGSPGVGVSSVTDLAVPADHVWSSTSRDDVIQYAAPAPGALVRDLAALASIPMSGRFPALGDPQRNLWFGHNPSDPSFGARVFASAPTAGHLGYWDPESPSLDMLAAITLGTAR